MCAANIPIANQKFFTKLNKKAKISKTIIGKKRNRSDNTCFNENPDEGPSNKKRKR